jgi:tetratricopeptide (TPR) repeat protein
MSASGADALVLEGNALFGKGDAAGAADAYRAALAADPRHSRALYNLGVVLQALQRPEEAIACYREVEARSAEFPKALLNWGNVMRERGDVHAAAALYRRALAANPRDAHAVQNILNACSDLERLGDWESLRDCARAVVAADPDHALARYDLGVAFERLGLPEEAMAQYQRAVAAQPGFALALSNWGALVMREGRLEEARELFRRAVDADEGCMPAVNNLATLEIELGNAASARALYARAARTHPEEVRYNLSLIDLREQDFERGWEGYEARTTAGDPTGLPPLTPAALSGAPPVAVWKEQGVGDQILFATLLPELIGLGIEGAIEIDARLLSAFRRSLPQLRFVRRDDPGAFAGCRYQIPLGSLPRLFRYDRESFSRQPRALLTADPQRDPRRSTRLGSRVIGMSWRSFQPAERRYVEARKSIPLECFAGFAGKGVELLDLQYGDVEEERRAFDARHPGLRRPVHGLDTFGDLEGVLAAIAACDLVVTASNVTAHFAGALGKRTWLVYLQDNPPHHYWVPGPDGRSLWYPSVEILADWKRWESAMEAVVARWAREP